MFRISWLVAIFFLIFICSSAKACSPELLVSLPYIVEHAVWRSWHQALIFTPKHEPGCQRAILHLVKCLGINGVASALNVHNIPRVNINIGLVILSPQMERNTTSDALAEHIQQLNIWKLNHASADWLIAARSLNDFEQINRALNVTQLRFDQNVVVTYPHTPRDYTKYGICENNFVYKNPSNKRLKKNNECLHGTNQTYYCINKEFETSYYRTSRRYYSIVRNKKIKRNGGERRLLQAGNVGFDYSRAFEVFNVSEASLKTNVWRDVRDTRTLEIFVLQYFKVRLNSTLYATYLGHWNKEKSMAQVEMPHPVEARNFVGENFMIGRRNFTADENSNSEDDNRSARAPELLDDLVFFLTVRMNATSQTRYYSKLGFRTYEGAWSGLLGALLDGSVDIALEPVTEQPSGQRNMDFIFPISDTMFNIYIRNQETSSVRDIFLAPFSPRLLLCVVAVIVMAALAIVLVCRLSHNIPKNKICYQMSCSEALVWSTGILCQQANVLNPLISTVEEGMDDLPPHQRETGRPLGPSGSSRDVVYYVFRRNYISVIQDCDVIVVVGGTWTPSSPAASVLLIVCLFFAVVTYNSYAAFITSVLSVRVANVGTVADVLQSPNMKIGYIRNGADQLYLMSTKDVQLNAFYIRGYSEAEYLVTSAEEGLTRAASQDYAFFAEQRSARSTLKSLSQARGRCALRELPVHSTRSQLSFPLPRRSPYSKPILVSLLQLRSSGALSKLAGTLVPAMPQCAPPSGFASARAADVQTAFLVITTGLISSLLVGIGEYCWKNRKENVLALKKWCNRVLRVFS